MDLSAATLRDMYLHWSVNTSFEKPGPGCQAGVVGLGARDDGSLPAELPLHLVDFLGEHGIQLHRLLVYHPPDELHIEKKELAGRKSRGKYEFRTLFL